MPHIFDKFYSWACLKPWFWRAINYFEPVPCNFGDEFAAKLQSDGLVVSHLENFFSEDAPNLITEIENKYPPEALVGGHKPHLRYWVGSNASQDVVDLPSENPLVRIATSPQILSVVENYIGKRCSLKHIEYTRTLHTDSEAIFSQRWHRDPGVECCVKVFMYLNNVSASSGPFSFFAGSHKRGRYAEYCKNTKWYGGGFYPSEEDLMALMSSGAVQLSCEGDVGTMVFCDTTGVHRGGLTRVGHRDMATFVYYPRFDPVRGRLNIGKS